MSGHIMAFDPLVYPDTKPFIRIVKPGNYPVKIYLAKTPDSGDRYALAKLEFSSERAEKWILAVTEQDSIFNLKEREYFGFPVDAGLGAFCDYKAGKDYLKHETDFMKVHPNGNIYDDFFAAEFKKNARNLKDPTDYGDWLNFKIPNSENNIIMFQSGYGDGAYPAYWGIDKNGEIVSLIVDFFVLLNKEE
ncbi:DUF4241 domain-containing protein [Flavobacterium sp. DG1-102-2]|uniref:DUF4241 domain-containing protein n=1 Tax=Flavobacterium sp. DG1-102-2 TaxID=3081663 RepID=UPI00294A97CA|nr:DUF4241 domain-containing protein [Flavobacterium sp. DG1-102-2]MDV6168730.1 DUF4241 domain-containing protein [Flavobacterium sp. DG1-102-2]